ncbi:MAG: hypothetical protein JNM43_04645 [Planctomycetaceae bacterium]|nr:hypothetical protein [Planctomycetaceae bacterium]
MQDHNSRFATFFEWRPEIPGTHPRHLETGLQFHNGGRRVEIDWHADLGCAVPVAIRVSLGNRPGGMFLRSCKLVRSRKVSAEDVRNEIQKAKNRTLADLTLINVGVQLSQHFWMQSPNDLDESHRKIALQFHAAYQQILKSPELSIGNEVSALRDLVILTAASDESPDLKQFRDAVRTYSRKIGETSGITGVATMMFDLLDMLRVWKREDLVDLVHAEFRTSLEQEKLEQQFSTLLSIAGPDEAREFSTECFLNVIGRIARCPELSEPDRLRIRAGLIVASYRLEHSLIEELAPANNAHIADAERRKQRRDQLTREYVDVLKLVEASEDDVLKDTAQVLQKKFAAMDFNEP